MVLASGDLCVGDTVFLDVAGCGSLATQGLSDTQVAIHTTSECSSWHQAAFLVRLQQSYTAEKALRAELQACGLSREQGAANPDFRHLFDAREQEQRLNSYEFQYKIGSDVRFGMVVQLQHSVSQKYLHVSDQQTAAREGRQVRVDRNAGEGAWFRIVPYLRVHKEGEPVKTPHDALAKELASEPDLKPDSRSDPTRYTWETASSSSTSKRACACARR